MYFHSQFYENLLFTTKLWNVMSNSCDLVKMFYRKRRKNCHFEAKTHWWRSHRPLWGSEVNVSSLTGTVGAVWSDKPSFHHLLPVKYWICFVQLHSCQSELRRHSCHGNAKPPARPQTWTGVDQPQTANLASRLQPYSLRTSTAAFNRDSAFIQILFLIFPVLVVLSRKKGSKMAV